LQAETITVDQRFTPGEVVHEGAPAAQNRCTIGDHFD